MNPLTQRLLMSAAGKAAIPGAWTLGSTNRTNDPIVSVGLLSGKLAFGFDSGFVSVLNNDGTWANADTASFVGGPAFAVDSVTQDNGQAYHVTGGRASVTTRTVGGGVQGQQFSTSVWGINYYRVISMRLVRNGLWIVGGERGALAQSLNYGSTGTWSQATAPGASSLGSLSNIAEIIYKETPAYSGDTTGWWAFFIQGGYIHTTGVSHNGISNGNPNLFSGSTLRTELSSLFKTGEYISDVKLILNQFVVLTNYGRIFLSYTGFNWELRTDLGSGNFINYEFFSALFDGQNYVVIANSPGNIKNLAVFTNKLDNITDIDDFKNFTTEPLLQNIFASNIFFHNNRYYITLNDGRYLYKDVTVTPVTKPVIQPMELTLTPTTTFNIYIDYFWYAGSKFELADVVVVNEEGQSVRESVDGSNITCTRIAYAIGSDVFFYGSTKNLRKLSIPSGASGKVKVFGRRYGFQTVQQFFNIPEYNTTSSQLSYITSIDKWGNAEFLTLEGAFANNRNLVNITNEVMPPFSRCHSMAGMFANCTSLNQFPKIPSALGAIITVSGMLYNCREFNQPIVNESGGILNTYRLADASYFLYNAGKWNNTLKLVLNGTGSPVPSYTKSLSFMFFGCSALTGTFDNSITNLELITDSQYRIQCVSMFENCLNLNTNLVPAGNYWNTSRVVSMKSMFKSATAFNGNIDGWNTSNVVSMQEMFHGASAFNRNISSWNTSSVTTMELMFFNASSFNQNLNTNGSSWNTANVTNMSRMFSLAINFNNGQLSNLKSAPLNWNTGKVISMDRMFSSAYKFNQDLNLFNTQNVIDMSSMFFDAFLFNGNISTWNTAKVTNMSSMFYDCKAFNQPMPYSVATGNIWNTSNVTGMNGMFVGAESFNQNIGTWNVSKVTNMAFMFKGASAFNNGGSNSISFWKTGSVTNMTYMFEKCISFNQILYWDTSRVRNMAYMFSGCTEFDPDSLTPLDGIIGSGIGQWNVSSVTDMAGMFSGARKFRSNIAAWDVSNVTSMQFMFFDAKVFNQPIGSWGAKTSKVSNMSYMFSDAIKFNQDLNAWDTSNVTIMQGMFCNTSPETTVHEFNGNIGNWKTNRVTNMQVMFYGTSFNRPIDYDSSTGSWNTAAVTVMEGMFRLSKFDQPITNWNVSNVVNMNGMFKNNTQFNQLISTWDTSRVVTMKEMFSGATAFNNGEFLFDRYQRTSGALTGWNTSKVTDMSDMFSSSNFGLKTYNWTLDEFALGYESNPRPQRISSWCVSLIPSAPPSFGFTVNAPVWGTCPTPPALQPVRPTTKLTISSNQLQLNLRIWAINNGWNGTDPLQVTINSGVYVYSDQIGAPALDISGSFPGGIELVNNGIIMGRGGDGGGGFMGSMQYIRDSASAGSAAISLGTNVSIRNNNWIGGGGGGGAGIESGGGGGAGGGRGAGVTGLFSRNMTPGGQLGQVGANGVNSNISKTIYFFATNTPGYVADGGGGGRVHTGQRSLSNGGVSSGTTYAGAGQGGEAGGGGGAAYYTYYVGNTPYFPGGSGGGLAQGFTGLIQAGGANGSLMTDTISGRTTGAGGGGGGYGAAGGNSGTDTTASPIGGAGGKCVALNGFTVTWLANGTRWGAIS